MENIKNITCSMGGNISLMKLLLTKKNISKKQFRKILEQQEECLKLIENQL